MDQHATLRRGLGKRDRWCLDADRHLLARFSRSPLHVDSRNLKSDKHLRGLVNVIFEGLPLITVWILFEELLG